MIIVVRTLDSVTCYSSKFYEVVRIKDSDYFNLRFKKTKKDIKRLLISNGLEFQYLKE